MTFLLREPVTYTARRKGGVYLTGEYGAALLREIEETEYAPKGRACVLIEYPEHGIEVRAESDTADVHGILRAMYRPGETDGTD